jgi:hypothetical protein
MDFKNILIDFIASLLIISRRFILLIFTPYKTMRKISLEKDNAQIYIIFGFVFLYFYLSSFLRDSVYGPILIFLIFIGQFLLTALFFYLTTRSFDKKITFRSLIFTLTYSLLPTIIWFFSNSLFYYFLPPPRRFTLGGKFFSVFFIAFSISLIVWKAILFFLSIRFASKQETYRVFYLILLYLCLFAPFSILLYQLKIFRIPFI